MSNLRRFAKEQNLNLKKRVGQRFVTSSSPHPRRLTLPLSAPLHQNNRADQRRNVQINTKGEVWPVSLQEQADSWDGWGSQTYT